MPPSPRQLRRLQGDRLLDERLRWLRTRPDDLHSSAARAPPPPSTRNLTRRADDDSGSSASVNPSALFDVPSALAAFNAKLGTAGSLSCDDGGGVAVDKREGGYKTNGSGKDGTRYCADKEEGTGYVWWQSNMDIDCDGSDVSADVCQGDGSFQSDTAFQDDNGKNIDAQAVQYVVIDQDDDFDPTSFGIQPLSVVAVLCGGKLTFGVWADTNALGSMGEASVHLGRVCFGSQINGNFGHSEPDVLYIAFPGSKEETVPKGYGSDEETMFEMGKGLVEKAFGADEGGDGGSTAESSAGASGAATSSHPSASGGKSSSASVTFGSGAVTFGSTRLAATLTFVHTSPTSPAASSDNSFFDGLTGGGGSTAPVLLLCAGIALLLAAGIAAWCVRRKAQQPRYATVAHPSGEVGSRRRRGSSSGSSGSESEESDDGQGEGKRLYREEGRRRRRRYDQARRDV
ncbi:hypothetical protein JCM10449v2_007503 [Rhodotorula kratochvilovae]